MLLAWLLPGLGHWWLGERRRARILAAAIGGLFVGGLLIGGIDVVDMRDDAYWFYGQSFAGPLAVAVGVLHHRLDRQGPPEPDDAPPYRKSIGRVNELGTLWCTLAGVLNLLAIFDASRSRGHERSMAPATTGDRP